MIGKKIKTIREMKNFTQEYMAKELSISQVAYSKIENEESDITIQRLEKIAEVLGIPAPAIMAFDEKAIFNISNSSFSYFNYGTNIYNNLQQMNDRIRALEDELKDSKRKP